MNILTKLALQKSMQKIKFFQGISKMVGTRMSTSASVSASGDQKNEVEQPPFTELQRDFLDPQEFYTLLQEKGIDFFAGVPDSLLKDFCAYVQDNAEKKNHIITANEGLAVSLGTGYHLATGWRGEPGKKDEPQHYIQGKVMNGILTEMGIQYEVLPDYIEGAQKSVESALFHLQNRNSPYALVVRRQTFLSYKLKNKVTSDLPLNREEAVKVILNQLGAHDVVVSTTGFLSRELWEIRVKKQQGHDRDFLTVGSMGHASSIAHGIALAKPSRNVFCFDGDGAALMHLGALTTIGSSKVDNLKHILFNNNSHDSVGGQPTVGFQINLSNIAANCGYTYAKSVSTELELIDEIEKLKHVKGPAFLEVKIRPGARKDLGRPKTSTLHNKEIFMKFLQK